MDGERQDVDTVVPLGGLRPGQRGRIVAISGGHGRQMRLAAMGLAAGVEVCVVQNAFRGPVILQARGARIALGRGVAAAIQVRPVGPGAGGAQ